MAPKRRATPGGSSCPHLDALSQPKRKKLLDVIWSNASQTDQCNDHAHSFQCVTCGRQSADVADHKATHPGKRLPTGHEIVLDLTNNEAFCTVCNDYVYCPKIDRTVTELLASKRNCGVPAKEESPAGPSATQPAAGTAPDALPSEDPLPTAAVGQTHSGSGPSVATTTTSFFPLTPSDPHPPGLRGLNNMGHTCFMNSILQAFLHAPLLPEHHLAQGHARETCPLGSAGDVCIACELDRVFSESYSGLRTPHSPAAFLHAWWTIAGGDLGGGCKQQDAHEFFLFVLEMLTAIAGRDGVVSHLFDGSLRSDVVCSACGATSTTCDHFTHLSLDIPPPTRLLPPPIVQRPNANSVNGKAGAAAAKAGKQLVGAAKAAYLAKLNKHGPGGKDGIEPTPETSSQQLTQMDVTIDDSVASEHTSGGTSTSGLKKKVWDGPRPSPPITESMAVPMMEQASGIDAAGGALVSQPGGREDAPTLDTLSSPQRKALPLRDSNSPSDDAETGTEMTNLTSNKAQGQGGTGPSAAGALVAHPALAAYLHWPGASLVGCLRRFVWPENLGTVERWSCSDCGAQQGAVKQLTLTHLPPILVMHAKRFEHSGGARATAKKLDTYLSFPLEDLDMAPYLTANALRARHVARPVPPANSNKTTEAAATPAPAPGQSSRPTSAGGESLRRTRSHNAVASGAGPDKIGCARSSKVTKSASIAALRAGDEGHDSVPPTNVDTAAAATDGGPAQPQQQQDGSDPNSAGASGPTSAQHASSPMYDLFSVVCHRGNFQGGHYVAYIRAADGKWYLCDDAYVAPVSEEVVRTCQAYMMFYAQQELLPWRGAVAGKPASDS